MQDLQRSAGLLASDLDVFCTLGHSREETNHLLHLAQLPLAVALSRLKLSVPASQSAHTVASHCHHSHVLACSSFPSWM